MSEHFQSIIHTPLPVLFVIGSMSLISLFTGKGAAKIKLPSLIGFMVTGAVLGPSVAGFMNETLQNQLSFLTEIALGFVALSIGLELHFRDLRHQGSGIILIIFSESFGAFLLVTAVVYLVTGDLPMSLIFGAIAPASAPAGTVAIIQEYKAKGSLTKALYSVVGFDDGLGIIIFGFAFAAAKGIIAAEEGIGTLSMFNLIGVPLLEVGMSFVVGILTAFVLMLLSRLLTSGRDLLILAFSSVLLVTGLCAWLHLSVILTNMIVGMTFTNLMPKDASHEIDTQLRGIMPILFLLFFTLAGANLHVAALPSLGLLGIVYIAGRTAGLIGGAWLGATLGKVEPKIRKYLGMGILSQAGVAIGLALIAKHELAEFGTWGNHIGASVITAVTATCIFFELVGPILTKIGLQKAGEIKVSK